VIDVGLSTVAGVDLTPDSIRRPFKRSLSPTKRFAVGYLPNVSV